MKAWDLRMPGWPLAGDVDWRPLAEALAGNWPGDAVRWLGCRWELADPVDVAEPELRALADVVARCFDTKSAARELADSTDVRHMAVVLDDLPAADRLRLLDLHWTWTIRRLQAVADGLTVDLPPLSPHDLAELDELAETEYYVRRARVERQEPVGVRLLLTWCIIPGNN